MKRLATAALALAFTGLSAAQPSSSPAAALDDYVVRTMADYHVPGATVVVVKDDRVVYRKDFGVANLEFTAPVDDRVLYPMFSASKIPTVVALYALRDQGRLDFDAPVARYLDDLPAAWRPVTVRQLMAHASGLPNMVAYTEQRLSEDETRQRVFIDPIQFAPGSRFDYNQTNYWLLKRILEKVTGTSIAQHVLATQFAGSPTARFEGDPTIALPHLATNYRWDEPHARAYRNMYFFPEYLYGAAALNATADDLIGWSRAFLSGKLLSAASMAELARPYRYGGEAGAGFSSGLALYEGDGIGFSGGASVGLRLYPKSHMAVIVLSNGGFFRTVNGQSQGSIEQVMQAVSRIAREHLTTGQTQWTH